MAVDCFSPRRSVDEPRVVPRVSIVTDISITDIMYVYVRKIDKFGTLIKSNERLKILDYEIERKKGSRLFFNGDASAA